MNLYINVIYRVYEYVQNTFKKLKIIFKKYFIEFVLKLKLESDTV